MKRYIKRSVIFYWFYLFFYLSYLFTYFLIYFNFCPGKLIYQVELLLKRTLYLLPFPHKWLIFPLLIIRPRTLSKKNQNCSILIKVKAIHLAEGVNKDKRDVPKNKWKRTVIRYWNKLFMDWNGEKDKIKGHLPISSPQIGTNDRRAGKYSGSLNDKRLKTIINEQTTIP